MPRPVIDITGQTFNLLTVLGRNPENGTKGEVRWDCECECGGETTVISANLRYGRQQSCGCVRQEWGKEVNKISVKARSLRKQANQNKN